jgi:hypothetical protein
MNQNQPFCQVNDVGVQFLLTIVDETTGAPINLSTATGLKVKFEYPDGTTADKTGTLYSGGVDGKLYYTSIANDLNQSGQYFIQGEATIGGATKNSEKGRFYVNTNIDDN